MSRRFEGDPDKNKDEETLGSFYMGRMQPPPENGRVMPRGLIAVVVVLAFAGILWYAYPDGDAAYDAADVPVIAADTAAFKSKPDDPGGMEVRHQDSTVFNPLVRKSADEVERLLPPSEQPMDKTNAIKSADAPDNSTLKGENEGLKLEPAMDEAEEGAEKVVIKDENDKPATLTELATARVPEAEAEIAPAVVKPEPKPEPKPVSKAATPVASGAVTGFYMQLGSFRNAGGAQEEWRKMQRKFPQSLSTLSSRVERADLEGKGVWYRLYAGPLPEGKARDICSRLTAENAGGCLVRKL